MSDMRDAIGVLLAGGQGERLWPLTRDRAKPAVPFGAIYRIIDVTLSNCINSALRKVFVLTQYKALSLNRHIRQGWSSLMGLGDYIEVLAPQMRVSNQWYQGTADAVYQNIYSIGSEHSKYIFILSGDHIYKMDYNRMLQQHVESGAEVTVGVIEVPIEAAAKQFGVIEVGQGLPDSRIRGEAGTSERIAASRGALQCVDGHLHFNTQLMIPILLADSEDPKSAHDFGKDILPRIISKHRVFAYNFVDENKKDALYWRDVGTLDAYYEGEYGSDFGVADFQLVRQKLAYSRMAASISGGEVRVCRSRALGRGDRLDRRRRIDRFGRARAGLDSGLRRARQQLQRSDGLDRLQPREYRTAFADSAGQSSIARDAARADGDRIRRGSGQAAVPCYGIGNCDRGAAGIVDRRARDTIAAETFLCRVAALLRPSWPGLSKSTAARFSFRILPLDDSFVRFSRPSTLFILPSWGAAVLRPYSINPVTVEH